MSFDMFTLIFC